MDGRVVVVVVVVCVCVWSQSLSSPKVARCSCRRTERLDDARRGRIRLHQTQRQRQGRVRPQERNGVWRILELANATRSNGKKEKAERVVFPGAFQVRSMQPRCTR